MDEELYGLYLKAFEATLIRASGDNRMDMRKSIIAGLREVYEYGYGQGWDASHLAEVFG